VATTSSASLSSGFASSAAGAAGALGEVAVAPGLHWSGGAGGPYGDCGCFSAIAMIAPGVASASAAMVRARSAAPASACLRSASSAAAQSRTPNAAPVDCARSSTRSAASITCGPMVGSSAIGSSTRSSANGPYWTCCCRSIASRRTPSAASAVMSSSRAFVLRGCDAVAAGDAATDSGSVANAQSVGTVAVAVWRTVSPVAGVPPAAPGTVVPGAAGGTGTPPEPALRST